MLGRNIRVCTLTENRLFFCFCSRGLKGFAKMQQIGGIRAERIHRGLLLKGLIRIKGVFRFRKWCSGLDLATEQLNVRLQKICLNSDQIKNSCFAPICAFVRWSLCAGGGNRSTERDRVVRFSCFNLSLCQSVCVCDVVSRHTGLETSSRRRGPTGAECVPLRWKPPRTGWVEAWSWVRRSAPAGRATCSL